MKLFFRKYGQGPALLILHGLYGSSDNWVHIARELENDFTVFLPDMRNHGLSPWSEKHSYKEMCEDILEMINDLSISKIFIAGHSMGGKVAALFAVTYPEKVSGLFIGDISPFPYKAGGQADTLHREILRLMNTVNPGDFNSRQEAEEYLTSMAGEKTTRLVFSKNITSKNGKLFWKLNTKSLEENIDNFLEGIPRPDKNTKAYNNLPVIVLKGDRSTYIEETDFKDIKTLFPMAQIKIAENSGHWIHTNNPEAVVLALKNLLALSTRGKCD